jgi:hypothetical protein
MPYSGADIEHLPEPWAVVPLDARGALEAELRLEVGPGHELHNQRCIAVARCHACDDVLFAVSSGATPFAVVHLTWRQAPEPTPWPITTFVDMPLASSLLDHVHR